jgi:hypothetical protein
MGRVIEAKKDSVGPVGMLKQLRPAMKSWFGNQLMAV